MKKELNKEQKYDLLKEKRAEKNEIKERLIAVKQEILEAKKIFMQKSAEAAELSKKLNEIESVEGELL